MWVTCVHYIPYTGKFRVLIFHVIILLLSGITYEFVEWKIDSIIALFPGLVKLGNKARSMTRQENMEHERACCVCGYRILQEILEAAVGEGSTGVRKRTEECYR